MKTYNTKIAIRIFAIIAAVDVVELVIGHFHPGGLLVKPAVIINSPALQLADLFTKAGSLGMVSFFGCLLFSAILWSLIAGYVFRRRHVA
jgi:hypothetical protein